MTVPSPSPHTSLVLDAEALYAELRRGVQALLQPHTQLVGIASGGAWLAERLHRDLGLAQPHSSLSSSLHRDDFAQRGLASSAQTQLHFDVNGADVLVLDDVLYTGRTVRAVINELFDYVAPRVCAWRCWWIGAGANCPCKPILLPPVWRWRPRNRWPWHAMRRVTFNSMSKPRRPERVVQAQPPAQQKWRAYSFAVHRRAVARHPDAHPGYRCQLRLGQQP